jgi:hypothetical protein
MTPKNLDPVCSAEPVTGAASRNGTARMLTEKRTFCLALCADHRGGCCNISITLNDPLRPIFSKRVMAWLHQLSPPISHEAVFIQGDYFRFARHPGRTAKDDKETIFSVCLANVYRVGKQGARSSLNRFYHDLIPKKADPQTEDVGPTAEEISCPRQHLRTYREAAF